MHEETKKRNRNSAAWGGKSTKSVLLFGKVYLLEREEEKIERGSRERRRAQSRGAGPAVKKECGIGSRLRKKNPIIPDEEILQEKRGLFVRQGTAPPDNVLLGERKESRPEKEMDVEKGVNLVQN